MGQFNRSTFKELERHQFEPILGLDNLETYLEQFRTKAEKIQFLQFLLDEVDIAGNVFIHPDSLEQSQGSCYLSRFLDPDAVQHLFSVTIPHAIATYSKRQRKTVENPFKIKLKHKHQDTRNFLPLFIRELVKNEIFHDDNSDEDLKLLFSSEDINKEDISIKFGVGPAELSLFINDILFRYFEPFDLSRLESSGKFATFKDKPFKAQDLYSAKEKQRDASNSPSARKISELKQDISKIHGENG